MHNRHPVIEMKLYQAYFSSSEPHSMTWSSDSRNFEIYLKGIKSFPYHNHLPPRISSPGQPPIHHRQMPPPPSPPQPKRPPTKLPTGWLLISTPPRFPL